MVKRSKIPNYKTLKNAKDSSTRLKIIDKFKHWQKNRVLRFLVLWLAAYLVLMSAFFRFLLKDVNSIELFPSELVFPSLMHATTALIIAFIAYFSSWIKLFSSKLILTLVLTLSFFGYQANYTAISGLIKTIVPGISEGDGVTTTSIIYLAFLLSLATLISYIYDRNVRKAINIKTSDVSLGVFILIGFIFISPAVTFMRKLPTLVQQTQVQASDLGNVDSTANKDKPDIYYIVFDRYTNAETLKQQFNYDNSEFIKSLTDKGYTTNNDAYSNYPYTTMSISSTINAQYTKDLVSQFVDKDTQSLALYHNTIRESSVIKALKNAGYQYHSIGSTYGASDKAPLADVDYMSESKLNIFGKKKQLRGVESIEFKKSPYYNFARYPISKWFPIKFSELDSIEYIQSQFKTLDTLAESEQQGGRVIFTHILNPHDPFYFNEDGSYSTNTGVDNVGKPIKDKYVGQVKFINSQIQTTLEKIDEHSGGNAVVILNSDEGPYPQILNKTFSNPNSADIMAKPGTSNPIDMRTWSDDWLEMKFGILQSVHIPKATASDLDNLSSVNLFRIVLNRYAGYDLDYLPECHFGLIKGGEQEYLYANISNRFVSKPNAECNKYQTVE